MKVSNILGIILIACMMMCLSGCGCEHIWEDATCIAPKTCTECNKTEGEPIAHKWKDATCTAPKTCTECNKTVGEPISHEYENATCESPKMCKNCQLTEGDSLGHKYKNDICERCGKENPNSLSKRILGKWHNGIAGYFLFLENGNYYIENDDIQGTYTVKDPYVYLNTGRSTYKCLCEFSGNILELTTITSDGTRGESYACYR